MSTKTWPDHLCSRDPARRAITEPLRFGSWYACTDGRMAVGLRDGDRAATEAPPTVEDVLGGYFEAKRDDWSEPLDVAELLEWCGPSEDWSHFPCGVCGDSRRISCTCSCGDRHESPCKACRIDRYELDRVGDIGEDVRLSRRLLAAILEGAPGDTVRLSPGDGGRDPILLHGEGWRGVLMPVRKYERTDDIQDRKALDLAREATTP